MNFDEAVAYLLSLGHEVLTMKLGLANIERLLQALGNPQRKFASVQIAGTNGKGSTAAVLDSICRAASINTGLYTSPHLISMTERIRIAGEPIEENHFAQLTQKVKQTAAELVSTGQLETFPTFFEHITALALLAFSEARVELAILETGLGGRLDATTAAAAGIVALTPIALDHQEYLGETLPEIASEKAAIIHPGATVIVGPQMPEALTVIMRHCHAAGVEPKLVDGTATIVGVSEDGRLRVTLETARGRYENVQLGLRGRHQVMNTAVALALAEALSEQGFALSREAIVKGIEGATHAGRLEIHEGHPRILFDGAHNPAAARALRDYLDEFVHQPITMIFGAMKDKALNEMADLLFPIANELILTRPTNPRAATMESLEALVCGRINPQRVRVERSVTMALRIAFQDATTERLISVTGSLYLVGEAQQILQSGLPGHGSSGG